MKFLKHTVRFNKVIFSLFLNPSFIILTVFGNLIITGFAGIFYWIEKPINQNINHFIDALWWGYATATTVGYGDIIPVSDAGKITGIFTMLVGTALFAQTILEDELFRFNFKKK